jgi:hypothetical protein
MAEQRQVDASVNPAPQPLADALEQGLVGNVGYPWDYFDPELYAKENYYERIHDDDLRVLQMVREYFVKVAPTLPPDTEGLDLGAGANLYPGMSMLPFCRGVTLLERSLPNRIWLHEQRDGYSDSWMPYWNLLAKRQPYCDVINPREMFRRRVRIRPADIFRPPARLKWGMGTMFFVAESITQQKREFKLALRNFIGLLKPGAPFAAAFMQESKGYRVAGIDFPAVSITKVDVEHQLAPIVEEVEVTSVRSAEPLKENYQGMILALGRARSRS